MDHRREKIGERFIYAELIIYGLFPIVANYSTKLMPPLLFAGTSVLVAGIFLLFYVLLTKNLSRIFNKKGFLYSLGVALFIVIIPSTFIYIGTKETTATNTAIFLQTEILFTLIICKIFFKEKITKQKILGGLMVITGTTIVLYNGALSLNKGELLIITGTFFYPIGNIFAKKALKLVPPSIILLIRSIIGGLALIILSIITENTFPTIITETKKYIFYILINGVLIMTISKLLWYEGLKRLDISKAIPISMAHPAFSLLFAIILLHEIPTTYQILGLGVIMVGVWELTRRGKKIPQTPFP